MVINLKHKRLIAKGKKRVMYLFHSKCSGYEEAPAGSKLKRCDCLFPPNTHTYYKSDLYYELRKLPKLDFFSRNQILLSAIPQE